MFFTTKSYLVMKNDYIELQSSSFKLTLLLTRCSNRMYFNLKRKKTQTSKLTLKMKEKESDFGDIFITVTSV